MQPSHVIVVAALALTACAGSPQGGDGADAPVSYRWADAEAEAADAAGPGPDAGLDVLAVDANANANADSTQATADAALDAAETSPDAQAPQGDDVGSGPAPVAGLPWELVSRTMATTARGHEVALVCHNCYSTAASTPAANLEDTLARLHAAQLEGADGLELDVKFEAGVVRVDHEDDGGAEGALLTDVLADPALQAGDQLLFIESKELDPDEAFVTAVLSPLLEHGFLAPGRMALLRAFGDERREALVIARGLLSTPAFAEVEPNVGLHVLWGNVGGLAGAFLPTIVDEAVADGLTGFEVSFENGDLIPMLRYAFSRGLTTGVWTLPKTDGAFRIAALREVTDVMVLETPLDLDREVVEADDLAAHLDVWEALDGRGADAVTLEVGEGLFGSALPFAALTGTSLGLTTPAPGVGVLVAALVRLDGLGDLAAGETWRLLGDDQMHLELTRDAGGAGWLTFTVRVAGVDRTARWPTWALDPAAGHLIVGMWGGDGAVRLAVDLQTTESSVAQASGGLAAPGASIAVGPSPPPEALVQQLRVIAWPHGWHPPAPQLPAAVPAGGQWERLQLAVRTADDNVNAKSDDGFELCLSETWCHKLDVADYDDNENGDIGEHLAEAPGIGPADVDRVVLRPTGNATDAWRPTCVMVVADGVPVHCNDDLNIDWLGSDATDVASWSDPAPMTLGCGSCYPSGALSHGPLVGHTTSTSADIWLRTAASHAVQVRYGVDPEFGRAALSPAVATAPADDFTAVLRLDGLAPDTRFHYEVLLDGAPASAVNLSFETAPAGPAAFEAVFGSCAKFAALPEMPIYGPMLDRSPALLLMVGDNHYANSTDPQTLAAYYRRSRRVASFAGLVARTPTWAIWDDHDYTGNNTNHDVADKDNSLVAFERYWANESYGGDEPGVWSRTSWGDVDFFLLDDRYYRDEVAGTMLGEAQLAWLLSELAASEATFKVLASGSQWTPGGSDDSWKVFPDEREALFDTIMASDVSGVVLISGDVHRSEIRRLRDKSEASYELWEFTSSPLANTNSACKTSTQPDTVVFCEAATRYYGVLRFDTMLAVPEVTYEIRDESDAIRHQVTVTLDQLTL